MTIKTFWTIFLKIFGLYLVWQIINLLPSFIAWIKFIGNENAQGYVETSALMVLILGFFIFVAHHSIFKTEWIINKLKLDKGFTEENIEINIHRSSLLSIAIIVLGGLMLVDGLPLFGYNVFTYIKHGREYEYKGFVDNPSASGLVLNFIKVLIGYFMVADSRLIVNFIERKRKKAAIGQVLDEKENDEPE